MVVQQITALLKLFGVYLSIHPEVDDRIAAGVEECEEENDGVDVPKVSGRRVCELDQLKQ